MPDEDARPFEVEGKFRSNSPAHVSIKDHNALRGAYLWRLIRSGAFAPLEGSDQAVIVALSSWVSAYNITADDNPYVFPSNPEMVRVTGYGRSAVFESITRLVTARLVKVIEVGGGRGNTSAYELLPPEQANAAGLKPVKLGKAKSPPQRTNSPPQRTGNSPPQRTKARAPVDCTLVSINSEKAAAELLDVGEAAAALEKLGCPAERIVRDLPKGTTPQQVADAHQKTVRRSKQTTRGPLGDFWGYFFTLVREGWTELPGADLQRERKLKAKRVSDAANAAERRRDDLWRCTDEELKAAVAELLADPETAEITRIEVGRRISRVQLLAADPDTLFFLHRKVKCAGSREP